METDYEVTEKLHEAGTQVLSESRIKQVKQALSGLVEDEIRYVQDECGAILFDEARRRADKTIRAVLNGDDDAAKKLLGDRYGSDRYRDHGYDAGKPWASLIHGSLFETGGIELRRKIVEAHADLIRNERIADLESIVEGLTLQILEMEQRMGIA